MPGLDGTGPAGMGPMTGGARGWCNPAGPMNAGYAGGQGAYGAAPWPNRPMGYGPTFGPPMGGYGVMPGMGMAWGRGRAPFGYGRGMARGRGGGRWW